jgi:hypothetical protein
MSPRATNKNQMATPIIEEDTATGVGEEDYVKGEAGVIDKRKESIETFSLVDPKIQGLSVN